MGRTEQPVVSMFLACCSCADAVAVVVLGQTCFLHAPVLTSPLSAIVLWHCLQHHIVMQEAWPQSARFRA